MLQGRREVTVAAVSSFALLPKMLVDPTPPHRTSTPTTTAVSAQGRQVFHYIIPSRNMSTHRLHHLNGNALQRLRRAGAQVWGADDGRVLHQGLALGRLRGLQGEDVQSCLRHLARAARTSVNKCGQTFGAGHTILHELEALGHGLDTRVQTPVPDPGQSQLQRQLDCNSLSDCKHCCRQMQPSTFALT